MNINSITKIKLSDKQISQAIERAFSKAQKIDSVLELTGGCFNSSYLIQTDKMNKVVLKAAPPSSVTVMRYEQNLIDTEVMVLNMLKDIVAVPVPEVIYYDNSGSVIESTYFLMEFIPGTPLNAVRDNLSADKLKAISIELADISYGINSIKSDFYGAIIPNGRRSINWCDEFYAMIKDIIEDAIQINFTLPDTPEHILSIIKDNTAILNEVSEPSLVHKDLWDGNIFVEEVTGKITGIIDCERALYGDPLLDVVCGFLEHNKDFLIKRFGRDNFTPTEQTRIKLYRLYLFLLMTIEQPYRKTSHGGTWPREQLEAVLKEF